ncbi:MAG: LPS-assembly protein LptD [Candidatus Eisenbacteria bacterium]|uniref:LPS-assembly protein LptD n=1 Tax=Eiseniibacteriota bacterium TaxID=2212470 RepID=A0A956NID2_UNCEI|nr:LPS-assembly protein LptD [Candidatus Eisenbacteria bacterium]
MTILSRIVLALLGALLLVSLLPWEPKAQVPVPIEPWIVEGDSLWGTRGQGSEILFPDITHGRLRITADRGRIDDGRSLLVMVGRVRIQDSLGIVYADQGVYRRFDRMLDLVGNVHGTGELGKFRSGQLTYDRRLEMVDLRGRPELSDSTRIIWADWVRYRSGTSRGEAHGDVRVLLLADSTWIAGDDAYYDEASGAISVIGDPWLYRPGFGRDQDLTVWADTLEMNEVERSGRAAGNVQIQRGSVRATGEEAHFELVRNRTILTGSPVAWDDEGEIRADVLDIRVRSGADDVLRAYGKVSVDYRPRTNPGEIQFVLGDTLEASIEDGEVEGLEAIGDAHSLFLPSVDEIREGTGRNLSRARRIRLVMGSSDADRVDLIQTASGEYRYPSARNVRRLRSPAFFDSIAPSELGQIFPDIGERMARDAAAESVYVARRGGADADSVAAARRGVPAEEEVIRDLESLRPAGSDSTVVFRPTEADSLREIAARERREERSRIPDTFGPPRPERQDLDKPIDPRLVHFRSARSIDFPDSLGSPLDALLDETVIYEGDTIRFYSSEDRLSIRGSGRMVYHENELASQEIDYFADDELVVAKGEPKLRDGASEVVGERMTYRTDEREGMVYQGKTAFDGGYYYGKEIKKLSDDALLVKDGQYTTCAEDPPHYSFHSSKMKLMMKDKAVARPVILHIRGIPVFAIPYYFFPLQKGRQSGFLFPNMEFGFNNNRGRFVRNIGYYWTMSDYADLKTWFDFYDRGPEFKLNADFNYALRYYFDGGVKGEYVDSNSGTRRKRWSIQGDHRQQFDSGAQLTMRANFRSDKSFIDDYDIGAGVDERLNRQLDSSASFSKSWSLFRVSVDATRTQYLDEQAGGGVEISESYPSVNLNVNSFPLGRAADDIGRGGRLPFLSSTYVSTSYRFRHVRTKRFEESSEENSAAAAAWSLRDTRSLGPYLRVTPSVSGNVAWFHEDNRERMNQVGGTWSASVSTGNTLYGTLPFGAGPLAGVRHVVEPSVSYSYQPEFESLSYETEEMQADSTFRTVTRQTFPSVGGIGLSGSERKSLSLSLSQRIHTKWKRGETVVKKENVLSMDTSTSYNYLAKGEGVEKWSDLSNTVQLRPFNTFNSSYRFSVDPYEWTNQSFDVRTAVRLSSSMFSRSATADTTGSDQLEYGELGQVDFRGSDLGNREALQGASGTVPWNLSLSHDYSGRRGSSRSQSLNASLGLTPTSKWEMSASAYYDLKEGSFRSHSFSMTRDLHCWTFFFEYRSSGSYYFRVYLRDIPEIQYETDGG